jgi:hypothetical protein
MNFTPRPTLTGTAVTLRNPEPRDVAFRLALGFDPAIAHMFGVDPNASDTVPALVPPTEATVEQWLDAIAKHPHSWMWHFTSWLDTLRSFSALAWAARRAPAPKLET